MFTPPTNDDDSLFPKPDPRDGDEAPNFDADQEDTYPILIGLSRHRPTGQFRSPRRGGPRSREFRD